MKTLMARLGQNGRLVIPAPIRDALALEAGDELVVTLVDGELRIATPDRAIARAQETVRRYTDDDASLVDELIDERRAEARSE